MTLGSDTGALFAALKSFGEAGLAALKALVHLLFLVLQFIAGFLERGIERFW